MDVCFLHIGDDLELPAIMVASVRKVLGAVRIVQFTDGNTPKVPGVNNVIRKSFQDRLLMSFRLEHMADFDHEEAIFLDTDIVVMHDIRFVFERDFNVALTRRGGTIQLLAADPYAKYFPSGNVVDYMPYNSGVIFSTANDFWARCLELCRSLPTELQIWFGDQIAIKAVADSGDYMVADLSCDEFNYSPVSAEDRPENAHILHFKGKRKEWMRRSSVPIIRGGAS